MPRSRRSAGPAPTTPQDQYGMLEGGFFVLSWLLPEGFAEVEPQVWDALYDLAARRGQASRPRQPPERVRPLDPADRPDHRLRPGGERWVYRALADRCHALAQADDGALAAAELGLWAEIWALGSRRGLVEAAPEDEEHHARWAAVGPRQTDPAKLTPAPDITVRALDAQAWDADLPATLAAAHRRIRELEVENRLLAKALRDRR